MQIPIILQYKFPGGESPTDWEVHDDSNGKGPYIKVWNLPDPQPTEAELQAVWDSPEFQVWDGRRKGTYIDRQTEAAINAAVHAETPVGEQLGVHRNALVILFNALGLEPPEDLAHLNEAAIAAIEDGQAKKEAL